MTLTLPFNPEAALPCELKKQVQQEPCRRAEQNAEHDRHGDIDEVPQRSRLALSHRQEGAEQDDDKNVVAGRAREYHLRNALFGTAPVLNKLYHPRHDHSGRNRAEYRAHEQRLDVT